MTETGLRPEDERLVEGILEGGSALAFEQLVERYQERVHRHVLGVLGPAGARDADDIVQEVFLKLFRKLATFRGESRFATWLFRLTRTTALDQRKKLMRRGLLGDTSGEVKAPLSRTSLASNSSPYENTAAQERATRLRRSVEELPEPYRSAVYSYYWLELSIAEVAESLGVPLGTAKSYLHRARARLLSSEISARRRT